MSRLRRLILFLPFCFFANGASATTYTLTDFADSQGYSATGTISTDGTLGFLSSTSFVDWSITISDSTKVLYTLLGPLSGDNSNLGMGGSPSPFFFATPTSITYEAPLASAPTNYVNIFNISANADHISNPVKAIGIAEGYTCPSPACYYLAASVTYQNPNTGNWDGSGVSRFYSGPFVVATVPEPTTWMMLLIGFAGIGFTSYRHSRKAVAS